MTRKFLKSRKMRENQHKIHNTGSITFLMLICNCGNLLILLTHTNTHIHTKHYGKTCKTKLNLNLKGFRQEMNF